MYQHLCCIHTKVNNWKYKMDEASNKSINNTVFFYCRSHVCRSYIYMARAIKCPLNFDLAPGAILLSCGGVLEYIRDIIPLQMKKVYKAVYNQIKDIEIRSRLFLADIRFQFENWYDFCVKLFCQKSTESSAFFHIASQMDDVKPTLWIRNDFNIHVYL